MRKRSSERKLYSVAVLQCCGVAVRRTRTRFTGTNTILYRGPPRADGPLTSITMTSRGAWPNNPSKPWSTPSDSRRLPPRLLRLRHSTRQRNIIRTTTRRIRFDINSTGMAAAGIDASKNSGARPSSLAGSRVLRRPRRTGETQHPWATSMNAHPVNPPTRCPITLLPLRSSPPRRLYFWAGSMFPGRSERVFPFRQRVSPEALRLR